MTKVEMLRAISERYGIEKNIDFARFFGITPQTGQPLSVKVEPEAAEIMGRRGGRTHLLDPLDTATYGNYERRLNKALKTIGMVYNPRARRWEGEPLLPGVSYYWARHTWATAAAELDIPERTIGAALGHSTSRSVTSVYIRVDMRRKVDAANRAVIDHLLGKNLESDEK